MKHSELIEEIKDQTGRVPKQREIADILDKPVNTISARASRDYDYDYDELCKLEDYYNIILAPNRGFIEDMNDKGGEILVDYYPDVFASCGGGTFVLSETKMQIKVPKVCIPDYFPLTHYAAINAHGDSMTPAIQDGDRLIIELGNYDGIKDNHVYIFCYNDRIFVKRLIQNIDKVIVLSDNPNKELYPTQYIEKEEMNNIRIIGRVVGLMRGM